jgi:hypothetical protein
MSVLLCSCLFMSVPQNVRHIHSVKVGKKKFLEIVPNFEYLEIKLTHEIFTLETTKSILR